MLKLNYFIHSILNSQYRLLITLIIYILIHITIKNTHIAYCMTEGNDLHHIAEAKSTNPEMPDLVKNIQDFTGSVASQLESRDQIIEEAKQQIQDQQVAINNYLEEKKRLATRLRECNTELSSRYAEIDKLTDSIEGNGVMEGYKSKISRLERQINELRRDLHISDTLLAEAKKDKNQLYDIIRDTLKKR